MSNIISIMHLNSLPKSRQPHFKLYEILLETIGNLLQQTKLTFVEPITSKMKIFSWKPTVARGPNLFY